MIVLIVVVVIAVVMAVAGVLAFNRLVKARNLVADGWAGVDVQLTRRAELVPNLVEVVKGYAAHEQQALTSVTEARTRVKEATGPAATGVADEQLQKSVGSLLAVAEAYPDLKANANFLDLQHQLATLEEDLAFARDYYNAVVRKYNTMQQTFPLVLLAGSIGFRPAEYFQADQSSRQAPHVDA